MMDWTDRHDRYFLRLIAPHVLLYTEMITALALYHGDQYKLLAYHNNEHPIALQLGGSDPALLAYAAKLGVEYQYDEINLNVGCPSPRVSAGRFGACLMLESKLVAECISAMQAVVDIPVTVKCRIGVDEFDDYHFLKQFIETIADSGCNTFIIHARKAWLKGLSPKQNREIPPLQYEVVKQIKYDFPQLTIVINGGFQTIEMIDDILPFVDGVMIGRMVYHQPYFLAQIEKKYFNHHTVLSRFAVVEKMLPYIRDQLKYGVKLASITRHMLGLFQGLPGAAKWRRYLSEHAHLRGAGTEVLERALRSVNSP
jgi:tRNA-dihydrouridine synthase A